MSSLNWAAFDSMSGSKSQNFENLCRVLIRLHFGKYGQFSALKNQPGVEFHLKLFESCTTLGNPPRCYGWQCKLHTKNKDGCLNKASKDDIIDSLKKTEKYLPELTDWVLWTPYTLCKSDTEWFESLETPLTLHLWTDDEIDTYLNGPGLFLRMAYFGELVVTPEDLKQQRQESVQLIKDRWLKDVHQPVEAERIIRRMLGETESWNELINVGQRLKEEAETILDFNCPPSDQLKKTIDSFVKTCYIFVDTLLHFHKILSDGDIDVINQKLTERKTLVNTEIFAAIRKFRSCNLPISLDATNALDDMLIAQKLLDEVQDFLMVGIVAVLSEAGGGKTQMAAQITVPQENRPAGVLLHGRNLHSGQTLNDLAGHFSINGNPLNSIDNLLAAIDAAAKRSKCRLPIVIDGLNEAENPKDWRNQLATINETLKRYPNVLVVCTLRTGEHRRNEYEGRHQTQTDSRESFAVMALPDDIMKIESKGFGIYTEDAIRKYFNYFKINTNDAEIPFDFFQHPLNLRIFCEVTNPKHESEVEIDYFPASLSSLFEEYISKACARVSQMVNLSYTADELESAIYILGIELWNSKKREIDEKTYRNLISDTNHTWNSSIVNLLAQEGIIFRNSSDEPYKYVITPVYDALGGYIVANSLLMKHSRDFTFQWLQDSDVIDLFIGENSHELASDIFRSLVTITPRHMHSTNLWKKVPEKLKNPAILFSSEVEAKFLDVDTIAELSALLRNNEKTRKYLFSRLKEIRGSIKHPLNSDFLDSTLRAMSVSERDLSWTEWVREKQSDLYSDLILIESKWKNNLATRTETDYLRAKWIMWLLTSTNREVRDVATRALYWFGRGEPNALFEESIKSLEINDPYVSERMLASSYGVAMAKHVDLNDESFVETTLSKYARSLYESMFVEGASYETTHLLSREYATRTIELAILHNSNLFSSEEMNRCEPPFTDGGLREWGESTKKGEMLYGIDSPFNMDFLNYTLGALVPHRRNYDFEHEGYQKLRAQILWRIEQLGWSSELFKDVDDSIETESYRIRVGNDTKKVDRYGKKYSWIAYFEMSGLLHDQRVIEEGQERTSSVDIDPSFPDVISKDNIIEDDFLGDSDLKEWLSQESLTGVDLYLQMEKVQNEEGPWILLDGDFTQKDKKRGRKLFCFIRSFLVENKDADSFLSYLNKQDLAGRWLPEKPSVYYTFAGEIPWCNILHNSKQTEFKFVISEETVKVQRIKKELYLEGKKLKCNENNLVLHRAIANNMGDGGKQKTISEIDFERIEIKEVPVEVEELKREYTKFNVLIPVCDFSWESYHSIANSTCQASFLAKEIAVDLDLIGQPQTFDLFTKSGMKVTFNVSDHSNDYNNHQFMFFMKEDMLKEYLQKNSLTLIWAIWGEREYLPVHAANNCKDPNHPDTNYKVFSLVKRY